MPYQKKVPNQKKYLIKKPYQESKKSVLSRNLVKCIKKVPYQESKQNTLSKDLINNLKKVPYEETLSRI